LYGEVCPHLGARAISH